MSSLVRRGGEVVRVLSDEDLPDRGIKYSRQHRHRLIKRGLFPRPLKIGGGTNAWLENEIDQYLQDRIAERDAEATGAGSTADQSRGINRSACAIEGGRR
jgi:prophage regulatory protein